MTLNAYFLAMGGFLVTGLISSLHCIGMCGPILTGFSQVWRHDGEKTISLPVVTARQSFVGDFAWYHLGRIWTYAVLGAIAGFVGAGVRHGSALMGWHQFAGAAIGAVVVLTGIALLGVVPGLRLPTQCQKSDGEGKPHWFAALVSGRGAGPRLLLGAVMGFLPCGLVYAMLVLAAAMPTPLHAAGAMVAFGIGTLPSLTTVLLVSHVIPTRWRTQSTRIAAVLVILSGSWMIARTLLPHDHGSHEGHGGHESHEMHHEHHMPPK